MAILLIGVNNMTTIEVLQNEVACVSYDCDRDCSSCSLALPDKEPIVNALLESIDAINKLDSIKALLSDSAADGDKFAYFVLNDIREVIEGEKDGDN